MPRLPGLLQAEVTVILVAVCNQVLIDLFDTAKATDLECTLFISSCNISASVTIQVCCKAFLFFSNNTFWVILGLILGFLGKSCCSEKVN